MKKVLSPEMVAHTWANQSQDEARTGNSNLYFNGDTIYSYGNHFQIAKHVVNENGQKAVLFTKRKYSVSTSAHVSTVRYSISDKILNVPDPANTHEQNFKEWVAEIEGIATKLKNARKPEKYLNEIDVVKTEIEQYVNFYSIEIPALVNTALAIGSKEDYREYTSKKDEYLKLAEIAKQKQVKKQHSEVLKKWRLFKTTSLHLRDGFDYLRINTEKNRLETSQGVQIPFMIAQPFYKTILDTVNSGGCTDCGYKFMNDYDVREINKDFIRIGCHKITLKEVKSIANKLNW